ncbi:WbqC family protein [Methanolobus profundi]|uniref:WbqC-like protein family protein n=1 Tax=Methanolobus profundi TaxID=487685 RepID=A0A1I4RY27_9EURY|nr:WbqC family protein [Methanolobus profundi]SFM56863.1 WbqC-like protein family protein [Methanolobus profundi]
MIVGIHQPNYLPYLGFFDKMKKSDIFVIYDDAQFNKGDFQHRNRIKIHNGSKWLTVPVEKQHKPINEIRVINDSMIKNEKWSIHHLNQIYDNYNKAQCFEDYFDGLSLIYGEDYQYLFELNMKLISFMNDSFDIDTKIVNSSSYPSTSFSTKRLIELVQAVGGDAYLSGPSGVNYLDVEMFEKSGIDLLFQKFDHPLYRQQYDGFIPNMSAIDSLLNGYRFD